MPTGCVPKVRVVGLMVTYDLKSLNLKLAMLVFQLKEPVDLMYPCVYQNVERPPGRPALHCNRSDHCSCCSSAIPFH